MTRPTPRRPTAPALPTPAFGRSRAGLLPLALLVGSAGLIGSVGCESWKTAKVDHPVLGPPPPRLSWNEAPQPDANQPAPTQVAMASGNDWMGGSALDIASGKADPAGLIRVGLSSGGPITDHTVVAVANGEAILAGELLAPYRPALAKASLEAPDWQVDRFKKEVLARDIDRRVEQVLLLQALRLMLKKEQLDKIDEQLDIAFANESKRLMAKLKVETKPALEAKLEEQGLSIDEYKAAFKTQQLAMLYLQTKAGDGLRVVGRQEILDYYREHETEYSHPARARFQLLMTTAPKGRSREVARPKMESAIAELKTGREFGEVVQQYSDGPRSDRGGQWDWIGPGDFADPQVDRALFSLPVGTPSQVFETPTGYTVVKVTEREDAGKTPVAELQDDIRDTLQRSDREAATKRLIDSLREKAVVTTYLE